MSIITPSLVDVFHHRTATPHCSGVLRVFVDGFGHDVPFHEHPPGSGQLMVQLHAIELGFAELEAVLMTLRDEEIRLAADRRLGDDATRSPAHTPGSGRHTEDCA